MRCFKHVVKFFVSDDIEPHAHPKWKCFGGVSVRSSWFLYIKVRTIRYLSGSVFRPGGLLWGERTLFVLFLLPLCISLQPEPSLTALSAKHMHLPFCLIEILRKAITQQEANLSVTPNRFVKDSL